MRFLGYLVFFVCLSFQAMAFTEGLLVDQFYLRFELQKKGVTVFDVSLAQSKTPKKIREFPSITPKICKVADKVVYFYNETDGVFHVLYLEDMRLELVETKKNIVEFFIYNNALILLSADCWITFLSLDTFLRTKHFKLSFQPTCVTYCGHKLIIKSIRNKIATFDLRNDRVSYHPYPEDINLFSSSDRHLAVTFSYAHNSIIGFVDPQTMATTFHDLNSKIFHIKWIDQRCYIFKGNNSYQHAVVVYDAEKKQFLGQEIPNCEHPFNLVSNWELLFVLVPESESLYILEKDSLKMLSTETLKNVKSIFSDREKLVIDFFSGDLKAIRISELKKT